MKKRQIISILNDLNIDKDKYIITGETALTIYGIIKECDYIFLMCSERCTSCRWENVCTPVIPST